jgi:Na+-translocating ferredoxin:NAD+ oxidoreductase subunit D
MIRPHTTNGIMTTVIVALLPGAAIQGALFGSGVWINVLVGAGSGIVFEALVARLRGSTPQDLLRDGSAIVTTTLLALSLPPNVPVTLVILGVVIGLGLGKHVFGGRGSNPFNPAMVGYTALLVSFPALLADWPVVFGADAIDGITAATPLDTFKHRAGLAVADIWTAAHGFGTFGGAGWEWLNVGYLLGGMVLITTRVIDWRIPASLLGTLVGLAALSYDAGSSSSLGSPLYHCFTGATMLGAFFIATDPVTCPATPRGRIWFGILFGALLFMLRSASTYADGVAFAVLLANAATPLIDRAVMQRAARTRS